MKLRIAQAGIAGCCRPILKKLGTPEICYLMKDALIVFVIDAIIGVLMLLPEPSRWQRIETPVRDGWRNLQTASLARGDDSGTHEKGMLLWQAAGLDTHIVTNKAH